MPGHRVVPRHPRHPAVSDTRHLPFITHNSHDWDYSGDCSLGVSGGRGGHLTVLTLPEFPGSTALSGLPAFPPVMGVGQVTGLMRIWAVS